MSNFIRYHLSNKTDTERTSIALQILSSNLEKLFLEKRNIMKVSPFNAENFQSNMETTRHYEEAIKQLERALEKQERTFQ
jgi:hypothetical protein